MVKTTGYGVASPSLEDMTLDTPEIIKQGSMPITNVNELMRYMNLAEKYWAKKEFEFLKNEFLAVGDYFKKSLNF